MRTIKHNFKPDAEYAPAPFDEKNLSSDWLEEFLFDNNCVHSSSGNEIVGYATFNDEDNVAMQVDYGRNWSHWKLLNYNYIDDDDVDWFIDSLDKYLADHTDGCTDYAYICTMPERDVFDDYKPEIHIRFYAKQ